MSHKKSVLIYEWVLGGGEIQNGPLTESLVQEANLMLQSVVADFLTAGFDTHVILDSQTNLDVQTAQLTGTLRVFPFVPYDDLKNQVERVAGQVDFVLVIAPETDECLFQLTSRLELSKANLLGPTSSFIKIATDKNETCRVLESSGIKVPDGSLLSQFDPSRVADSGGWIVKRRDGAGAENNHMFQRLADIPLIGDSENWRIERWIEGRSGSLIVISNGQETHFTPPTWQNQNGPAGTWTGCSLIEDASLAARAQELAKQVVEALPVTSGIWGIDFVLGETETDDTVIEVNPRLTSSYAFVRSQLEFNPAEFLCFNRAIETMD